MHGLFCRQWGWGHACHPSMTVLSDPYRMPKKPLMQRHIAMGYSETREATLPAITFPGTMLPWRIVTISAVQGVCPEVPVF